MHCTHLVEVGQGRALSAAVEVWHVDELEVEGKAGVGSEELGVGGDGGQVAEVAVPPVVQLGQGGPRTALQVGEETGRGDACAGEAPVAAKMLEKNSANG